MADGVNYPLKGFDQYEVLLGDELRGERATVGKSLLDVQRDLKIKAAYIAAIENCDLEVFSNRGFIAGYVRSYARYLDLNPEIVYERFCLESGFSNNNTMLTLEIRKPDQVSKQYSSSGSNWKPGKIGQIEDKNLAFFNILVRSSPVLLVLFVLFGVSFGAISVLKQVQRLDIVAFEEVPEIFTESPATSSSVSLLDFGTDIYSSEELALPVFEPRDKALSSLQPNLLTALEDIKEFPLIIYNEPIGLSNTILGNKPINKTIDESNYVSLGLPEPVLRTSPNVPQVKIFAVTPAWVRLKNESGDVVFEKILKQGETYLIGKELFKGELRAGNAQNVYFVIDDRVLGPLAKDKSVVKKISLDPKVIMSNINISIEGTKLYKNEKRNNMPIDTAEVVE